MEKFGKDYKRDYYLKNKSKWSDELHCDICNSPYTRSHKWQHENSKTHKINLKLKDYESLKLTISALHVKINGI
jgi:hypothetical protein